MSEFKLKPISLKKLINIQAFKMEQFIKEKGLYDEFYEKYVMLDLELEIDFDFNFVKDFYTGEFQRKHPLSDKSYNEYLKEYFNGDK